MFTILGSNMLRDREARKPESLEGGEAWLELSRIDHHRPPWCGDMHRNEVPSYLLRLTGCKNFAFSCWGGNYCLQFTLGANKVSPVVTIDVLRSTSPVDKSSECCQKCLRRHVTHKFQVNCLSDSTNKKNTHMPFHRLVCVCTPS